jgi:lauroyl/myristoyl acyltransferase
VNSTKPKQTVWQSQPSNQIGRSRLFSAGDITYVSASFFLGTMQLLPASQRVRVVNRASKFLAGLLTVANVHSTQTLRHNLEIVLGQDRLSQTIEEDVRHLLSITIWNSLIMNTLPVLPRQHILDLVPVDGLSWLDDYRAEGSPVLVWAYHFGVHPLIVAAVLHAHGYPINAITHVRHVPAGATVFQRFYLNRLKSIGDQFPVINPQEGLQRKMLDVLRGKECLYITPDYMIPVDEIEPGSAFVACVDFLGRKAWLQTGGLRLAKRLKARVVTVISVPGDRDQPRLVVEPLELPTSGLTPAELQQDLQVCMQYLEGHVLRCPDWWWDVKRDDLEKRLMPNSDHKQTHTGDGTEGQTDDED